MVQSIQELLEYAMEGTEPACVCGGGGGSKRDDESNDALTYGIRLWQTYPRKPTKFLKYAT